jgi:protein-L-isoaspartate O-methyltransferase
MLDGERQVALTVAGIRKDHVARYEFAKLKLSEYQANTVIDFACGVGYGACILAKCNFRVGGFDIDQEAIDYANTHYSIPGMTNYGIRNANRPVNLGLYDAAVCFETIEHLADPKPLLLALSEAAPLLICSVPNEDVMPYEISPGVHTKFHYRHYTKFQLKALLEACGWRIDEWYGQKDDQADVEASETNGRTLVVVARKDDIKVHDDGQRHIAILGLGPSLDQYVEITKRLGGRHRFCDETWVINALGDVFACDLVFHMDDVRIQMIRADAAPASNIAALLDWMKHSKIPIITSRSHPDYPSLVEFPLEDSLNNLGHDYFNSTAAYAVAFAIHIGATTISLFGLDFTYESHKHAEKGRACVEFWLGQAHARGIKINLPKTTSLLDSYHSRASRLYGYDCVDVAFNSQEDGTVKLEFTNKTTLPTAEMIEKNYDHSAPIGEQHVRD